VAARWDGEAVEASSRLQATDDVGEAVGPRSDT
jgi:hypothetical protein